MSRNKEKSQSMLHRYYQQQMAASSSLIGGADIRPRNVRSVTTIRECEKWRHDLIREVSRKITKIQDPLLTEAQIIELNDEINTLMRQKYAWEHHLVSLGGPNYLGKHVPGVSHTGMQFEPNGERYYGRAKDLPHVRELLDARETMRAEAEGLQVELMLPKNLSAEYYGMVELDPCTLSEETEYSEKLARSREKPALAFEPMKIYEPVPTPDQVQQYLVEQKRKELLMRLTT